MHHNNCIEILVDYKLNEDTQSLDELWESIAKLATGRVKDNSISTVYPLETRKRQLDALLVLANAIKATHTQIDTTEK